MSGPNEIPEDELLTLESFGEMGKFLIASWGAVCVDIEQYQCGLVKEISPTVLGVFENFQYLLDTSDDLSDQDIPVLIGPFKALRDLSKGELSDSNLSTFYQGRHYILENLVYATKMIEGLVAAQETIEAMGKLSGDYEEAS